MKKVILFFSAVIIFTFSISIKAQNISEKGGIFMQYYSKKEAEFKGIEFLINNVLELTEKEVISFTFESLSASATGEITALFYSCEEKGKTGLIIGFFNINWVPGAIFKKYQYLNLTGNEARALLNRILTYKRNWDNGSWNENTYGDVKKSIAFKSNGLTFVMDKHNEYYMRVYWNDFDSSWGYGSLTRSRKRFERHYKKKE